MRIERILSSAVITSGLAVAAIWLWQSQSHSEASSAVSRPQPARTASARAFPTPVAPVEAEPTPADAQAERAAALQARVARATAALGIDEEEIAEHATAPMAQIEEELAALRETAQQLRSETLSLQEQHRKLLADGKNVEAERLVEERILPMYEERDGLVREAVLLARVRAVANQHVQH